MPPLPHSATIVVADDLVSSDFGDELVVLDLRDGVYYGLEDVGARIWKLVQTPISIAGIRDALLAEYDVEPERCDHDVRALVAELAEKRLVRIQADA